MEEIANTFVAIFQIFFACLVCFSSIPSYGVQDDNNNISNYDNKKNTPINNNK